MEFREPMCTRSSSQAYPAPGETIFILEHCKQMALAPEVDTVSTPAGCSLSRHFQNMVKVKSVVSTLFMLYAGVQSIYRELPLRAGTSYCQVILFLKIKKKAKGNNFECILLHIKFYNRLFFILGNMLVNVF